jgi:hypothetical protein
VARGLEVDIHLRPGLANDAFVAEALGNLAAHDLSVRRGEHLEWQVLRVEGSGGHHFRLVVRHPERALDVGIGHDLRKSLDALSQEDVAELRQRFLAAQKAGLRPVPLRHVHESVDFWRDDFWNWIG